MTRETNIKEAIKRLYELTVQNPTIIVPRSFFYDKVLSKRYKGKGRPKEDDYDHIPNDMQKYFGATIIK